MSMVPLERHGAAPVASERGCLVTAKGDGLFCQSRFTAYWAGGHMLCVAFGIKIVGQSRFKLWNKSHYT
jgi:hypothetical protein